MDTIRDRNGMDLTEAEEEAARIHRRTIQTDLHKQDNHEGVITPLEPDILDCEVKWALGIITTTKLMEVMEFQLSYFKS